MLSRRGFSLMEMLVVVALLSILFAVMIPAVQRIRESGNRTACANNLRNIGTAFLNHKDNWKIFPDGGGGWIAGRSLDANGQPAIAPNQEWGWAYQILPYIDQVNTWKASDPAEAARLPIPVYFCPSRRAPTSQPYNGSGLPVGIRGSLDYAASGGSDGAFPGSPMNWSSWAFNGMAIPRQRGTVRVSDVRDGLSTTLLVSEKNMNLARLGQSLNQPDDSNGFIGGYDWDVIRWPYQPPAFDRRDSSIQDTRFGSSHNVGMNCVFADGGLRFLHYGVDLNVFRNLCNRRDGQAVSLEDL